MSKPEGVLNGIKSKLGFVSKEEHYDDENYDEEYYDDYEESLDEDYGEYGYGTSAGSSYRESSFEKGSGHPKLVSIDDVKANTSIPDSLNRDPLPSRVGSSASGASYRQVERAADYLKSTNTSDLVGEATKQSDGLNSLFSSTSEKTFDPYETFEGTGQATHNPTRGLSVMKPVSYSEVERIAKIIKAGDVVVLSLRNTPDHLAKRILDFSFGVSSALDASVECIADKVFVIIRGSSLTTEEKTKLRSQGVIS